MSIVSTPAKIGSSHFDLLVARRAGRPDVAGPAKETAWVRQHLPDRARRYLGPTVVKSQITATTTQLARSRPGGRLRVPG